LAQRLAQQYGLLHINTAAVLAELPLMDAETQKVGKQLTALLLRRSDRAAQYMHQQAGAQGSSLWNISHSQNIAVAYVTQQHQ
jgi:hypothetical protein